jgi:citrate-Mg2+:H+ or citrate-Ca2+:H+ symporter, CitMHS family
MLIALGFLMIAVFMFLIMTKRLTPMVALVAVPVVFGLLAGAGLGIGDMIANGIKDLAPTAALLLFAIAYFGIMIDVGLFDPLVRAVLRVVKQDPARLVLGTALLASAVSLDGDGSTTFIITVSALLPLYLKLKMNPVVLTCVAGLANGVLNILPWGGPTARAASALKISTSDVFVPLVPSLIAGLAVVFLFAWHLGLRERRRLSVLAPELVGSRTRGGTVGSGGDTVIGGFDPDHDDTSFINSPLDPGRKTLRPHLLWFNAALTVAVLVLVIVDILPIFVIFMIATAIALVVNFRTVDDQRHILASHASSVISVVSMVLAAGVFIGILQDTGMVAAMAHWLVSLIPSAMGPHLAVICGLMSIPLTFLMSNDAFYFGILPVLSEAAANYGIAPVEMARASVIGQPIHMQSPLVPAILLLVGLAKVELGDHHRKVLWRALVASLVMLAVGIAAAAIPVG